MDWKDIPSLAALRGFEAAARHGSLSAAARDLNVTHAAIAQHVRTLEDHYGLTLLRREGRGMVPTSEGRRLAEALSDAFATIAVASTDLIKQNGQRPLRVALTPSFAANWLMPRLGAFWVAHPEIQLELLPSISLVDLRGDNVDVAIRYGAGDWPLVDVTPLMSAGHIAVATPGYLGGRKISCLEDLKGAKWLLDGGRNEERMWLARNGIDVDQEDVTVFATGNLAREAARAGLGIALMSAPIAAADIAAGTFVALCRENDSKLAYHILTRPEVVSKQRDVFVRWLKSEV